MQAWARAEAMPPKNLVAALVSPLGIFAPARVPSESARRRSSARTLRRVQVRRGDGTPAAWRAAVTLPNTLRAALRSDLAAGLFRALVRRSSFRTRSADHFSVAGRAPKRRAT